MSTEISGPAARIARVREMMAQRGYDAVVVRDEANLRWLTGAMGVFDYTFEFPHVALISRDRCFLHTDSRYFNSFEENLPAGNPWELDMDQIAMPRWVADRALETKSSVIAVEDDMQISFYFGIQRGLEDVSICASLPQMHGDIQRMRAVKDSEEIELMRRAQSITDAAFAHMCEFIRPGLTEKQIRTSSRRSCSTTERTPLRSHPLWLLVPTRPIPTLSQATAWSRRATSSSWIMARGTATIVAI